MPKDPWYQGESLEDLYPTLEEGVYISAGAKILGPVRIGAWSVIGANAVRDRRHPALFDCVRPQPYFAHQR